MITKAKFIFKDTRVQITVLSHDFSALQEYMSYP